MPFEALSTLLDGMLSLIFPPRCEVCGTLQEPVVCARCHDAFRAIHAPYCQQCGLPFDPLAQSAAHCAICREEPPTFDAARAAGAYENELRRAIHLFKYDGVRALAAPLAAFVAETITFPFEIECLCPVPLHPQRATMRGYNQSELLAEEMGEHWSLPVIPTMLTRTVNTTPQMQLPAAERKRNVKGAFAVSAPVAGRTIGLVDDVYTTGSTLSECSRILKRAGAQRVLVLTVARALLDA